MARGTASGSCLQRLPSLSSLKIHRSSRRWVQLAEMAGMGCIQGSVLGDMHSNSALAWTGCAEGWQARWLAE